MMMNLVMMLFDLPEGGIDLRISEEMEDLLEGGCREGQGIWNWINYRGRNLVGECVWGLEEVN